MSDHETLAVITSTRPISAIRMARLSIRTADRDALVPQLCPTRLLEGFECELWERGFFHCFLPAF